MIFALQKNYNAYMEITHFDSLYPNNTRFDEIEKILSFIKEGNSAQLVSIPGVGRSSFLGLLAYNRNVREKHMGASQKNFHFVYLNFSEIRIRPLSDVFKFIFIGILDSLKDRGFEKRYEEVNKIFKESAQLKDELVIFSGLKKAIDFLALQKDLTIVLLFDRFDEYLQTVDNAFFAGLRVLRNRAKYKFSIVFSLNRPLEDTFEPTFFADFYDFVVGKIVYLPITDATGVEFRIAYLEKITNKKLDNTLKAQIFELTGGHTNLMRLCAESLLASSNAADTTQKLENKQVLRKYFLTQKPVRSALFAIWNFLTPQEQNLMAKGNYKETPFLEKVGLVNNGLLTIALFGDYVKEKSAALNKSAKIEVNQKGEIIKGQMVLSDKLTSLEYKLLKYMLENKERILEKEEIINAIWGDQKTVLGVTDQALDQLIFRLRKKIEDNPNVPENILTIKGRGFKFAP